MRKNSDSTHFFHICSFGMSIAPEAGIALLPNFCLQAGWPSVEMCVHSDSTACCLSINMPLPQHRHNGIAWWAVAGFAPLSVIRQSVEGRYASVAEALRLRSGHALRHCRSQTAHEPSRRQRRSEACPEPAEGTTLCYRLISRPNDRCPPLKLTRYLSFSRLALIFSSPYDS